MGLTGQKRKKPLFYVSHGELADPAKRDPADAGVVPDHESQLKIEYGELAEWSKAAVC